LLQVRNTADLPDFGLFRAIAATKMVPTELATLSIRKIRVQ